MAKYAIFLELRGRRAVVIGGGSVAVRKAQALIDVGARLIVVAHKVSEVMTVLCSQCGAELIRSRYTKQYLAGASLVIAATNDNELNTRIYKDCQELEILCNVVDNPELCDFFVPAVVKRGGLQIAISTEGYCPAYAGHIRKKLEKIISQKHGDFLAELEKVRQIIINDIENPAERKILLGELVDDESFEFFISEGPKAWRERAESKIKAIL